MRMVCAVILACTLAMSFVGCSKDNRPPLKEDTAANPSPQIVNIPKPSELPPPGGQPAGGQK